MEGVVGAVSAEQLGPGGFEYQRFREFMTKEVNAAIDAAFEAGATEIVVSDSHGNALNLLIEKLPKNILLVRGFPRPLMMMQGIDESFDGVIFIGYHASTTNPQVPDPTRWSKRPFRWSGGLRSHGEPELRLRAEILGQIFSACRPRGRPSIGR